MGARGWVLSTDRYSWVGYSVLQRVPIGSGYLVGTHWIVGKCVPSTKSIAHFTSILAAWLYKPFFDNVRRSEQRIEFS